MRKHTTESSPQQTNKVDDRMDDYISNHGSYLDEAMAQQEEVINCLVGSVRQIRDILSPILEHGAIKNQGSAEDPTEANGSPLVPLVDEIKKRTSIISEANDALDNILNRIAL